MSDKTKTYFLTGATGLLGSYLTKVLLENNHRVYVLARSKNTETAQHRVHSILNFWDENILKRHSKNLFILEGDITKEKLGLNNKNLATLKNEVEEIFHCAANITFNLPLEQARTINVEGVRNLLGLAYECNKTGMLKKINHLSTAYVCGDYKGVFHEHDLELGQSFLTTYERSKFEAEKLVNEFRAKNLWIDIFRIPVAGAEAVTGKTPTFQAFYQMLDLWCKELLSIFPGKGVQFDYIPVDVLCKAIYCLSMNSPLENQNYHPFFAKASLDEIAIVASDILDFKKPRLVPYDDPELNILTSSQKKLLDFHVAFFNRKVTLSSKKTIEILKSYGFTFTDLDEDAFVHVLTYFKENRLVKTIRSEKH